jgi:acyl-CoA synthetase (AMP-forming)/AMP-acid ligase II
MRDIISDLFRWAAEKPSSPAFLFLTNTGAITQTMTFAELRDRAVALAARLRLEIGRGDRAALMFYPGLDFVVAFFACLHAGLIAVPMAPPRRLATRDATEGILANAAPRILLTTHALAASSRRRERLPLNGLAVLEVDRVANPEGVPDSQPLLGEIAFLQYTSGSTSDPKGVVVTHDSLASNLAMMKSSFGTTSRSVFASWLPLFHDMGLVANALHAVSVGATCILMAPLTFMQRPIRWLRAISDHRVNIAGAPNFAFDHCVDRIKPEDAAGLDLSCWRVAFNGAEPVQSGTLDRFARAFATIGFDPRAFFPCYGMAETTVMISGKTDLTREPQKRRHDGRTLVSCGSSLAGEEIAIVEPALRSPCPAGATGEIWVRGPHVSPGYWRNDEASAASFGAHLDRIDDTGGWLRTGDLAFLDENGELFVTGRLKDTLIIRGQNYYPQDLEWSASDSHPALQRQMAAAFAIAGSGEEPKFVLLQEVERKWRGRVSVRTLEAAIREALAHDHGIAAHRIVIVASGVIPRTTSGKVQRARARELWCEGLWGAGNEWKPYQSVGEAPNDSTGADQEALG